MEEEVKKLNFLEEIIENDLKTGKVSSILTRFPPAFLCLLFPSASQPSPTKKENMSISMS